MDLNAFERKVRSDGVRFVRFLYCDPSGIIRGKAVHVDKLVERMQGGIGLTVAMPAMNMLAQLQPVEGLGPVGEIRLVPDPESYAPLPYAAGSAAMMANMTTLGRA
ncbi:MAG: glutamine synthetase, partial [Alphaproteobacteria bacterium]|nr:glutamine synthetase [Alphaproteobacteria bacterium]